jgi:hypothetical protein
LTLRAPPASTCHCSSHARSAQASPLPALQEKLSQAKEDELQASLADTAKALEEARAAAQEQARRLADEERQLARLQHEADMKVAPFLAYLCGERQQGIARQMQPQLRGRSALQPHQMHADITASAMSGQRCQLHAHQQNQQAAPQQMLSPLSCICCPGAAAGGTGRGGQGAAVPPGGAGGSAVTGELERYRNQS